METYVGERVENYDFIYLRKRMDSKSNLYQIVMVFADPNDFKNRMYKYITIKKEDYPKLELDKWYKDEELKELGY